MNANFIIRLATPDDAAQYLEVVRQVANEAHNGILLSPGEEIRTVDEQRKVIEQRMATDNSVFFVAEVNGQIVGHVSCVGGAKVANRHTTGLGITIVKEWRGKGVGTALMQYIIDWARANPVIKRVELEVFTINPRAVKLYERFGFEAEGVKRQVYFKDGEFVDSVMMAIVFER
jgi:RimJ/RimL family protein N-acetyltransferase